MSLGRLLVIAALVAGCNDDVDLPWELDHDRIIAVRATPPRIEAGAQAELDALIGRKGDRPTTELPAAAMVVSPESLADTLALDGGRWIVTAPGSARLDEVRLELGLPPGAPVPVVVGVAVLGTTFPSGEVAEGLAATKTVWLGESGANPVLDSAEVDGVTTAAVPELVVGREVDVPLAVGFEETDDVNWLTSCGTMHDYDLPAAYLRVEPEDPTEGHLAVVVRTPNGGVAWQVWPIRAE